MNNRLSLLVPSGRLDWQGLLLLLRPFNVIMFMAGAGVGGILSAGVDAFSGTLLLAMISAALIGGGSNAINDFFDEDIDRLNRPERPIPSGRVSGPLARLVWLIASAAGVGLSLFLGLFHVVVAVLAVSVLYIYSARLKRLPLAGNLTVALVVALALVYGGAAVGTVGATLVGAGFAFLTTLAREIIKDIEDAQGDRAAGAATLPLVLGIDRSIQTVIFVLVATILLTPVPFLLLAYGGLYLLLVFLTNVLLIRVSWLMLGSAPPAQRAARASQQMKLAMLFGLAALATARIF